MEGSTSSSSAFPSSSSMPLHRSSSSRLVASLFAMDIGRVYTSDCELMNSVTLRMPKIRLGLLFFHFARFIIPHFHRDDMIGFRK